MNNVKNLLKKRLSPEIYQILTTAGEVADKIGYSVFAVGGFVRDLLLNIKDLDVDLVVEGEALRFAKALAKVLKGEIKRYQAFGTASLILPDNFKIDIATARCEFYPAHASLPEVKASSLKEDLHRRDFTINTLAIKLNKTKFGELIDFFAGQEDLKKGLVSVLHNLSFFDDPTRIFRALRFANRYNFKIEEQTLMLIKGAMKAKILAKLSPARLRNELILILKEKGPFKIVKDMENFNILKWIHPKIKLDKEISFAFPEMGNILLQFKKEKMEVWIVYFLILTYKLKIKELSSLLNKFKLSRKVTKIILQREEEQEISKKLGVKQELKVSIIYKCLSPLSCETILYFLLMTKDKKVQERIFNFLKILGKIKIKITGKDLEKLGYKPSPKFKKILAKVLAAKLEGKIGSKKEELQYVVDNF